MFRLNPFEFRAGLRGCRCAYRASLTGLNPFEFRAGLRARRRFPAEAACDVLIPLNSGQAYELMAEVVRLQARGLNPFEFRAGLRGSRQTKSQQQQRQVLIPLNSGQAYEGGPCRA